MRGQKLMLTWCLIGAGLMTGAAAAHAQLDPGPWPMFHQGITHRGQGSGPFLASPSLRWSFTVKDSVFETGPAVGLDGTVYVASMDSGLYSISRTGTLRWKFHAGGPLQYSSPALGADSTVYVGGMDSTFYAIKPDGTLKWKYRAGSTVRSSPAIAADGTIYVGSGDNNLYAFNPGGTIKWTFTAGNNVRSSPAIGADGTVYVGSDDSRLYAVNPATGAMLWSFNLGSAADLASPTVGPDSVIYIGTTGGLFYALRPTGAMKWVYSTGHAMYSAPAILPGGNIAITIGSDVRVLSPASGTLVWRRVFGPLIRNSAAVASDGTIYAGCDNDSLVALDPATGATKWVYRAGKSIRSSPALGVDGTIYFGSFDGTVRALGTSLAAVGPAGRVAGANALTLSPPEPNPARSEVAVSFGAAREGAATLEVHAADGRLVRRLYQGVLSGGGALRSVRWDGRDESGRQVAAGIYWLALKSPAGVASRRVVLVK